MSTAKTTQKRRQPHSIADNIWMWSAPYGDSFFNSFMLQIGKQQSVLIDPFFDDLDGEPLMEWSVFDELPAPQAIWLTSSDHERDSDKFHKHFDIPVRIAKPEAGLMSHKPDEYFQDEEQLPGGWQVLQLNHQKTPAECAFYHAKQEILLIGDALLAESDDLLRRPYDEPSYPDEKKAQQSLETLKNLSVKTILLGHGDPIFKKAHAALCKAVDVDPRELLGLQ